jgi:hypothetical protein
MIEDVNIATLADSTVVIVRPEDEAQFTAEQPYGYTRERAKSLTVDGSVYLLRDGTSGPVATWSAAAVEAQETAKDAVLAALTPSQRAAIGASDWEPFPVRRAKRIADDAEADVRALEARNADEAALAAAKADAQAKRDAADALTETKGRGR